MKYLKIFQDTILRVFERFNLFDDNQKLNFTA